MDWKNKFFILLSILFLIALWIGLDSPPWDQDEAAYFGFSRNMLEKEQFLIPEFPLSNLHRKTPLHFWIGAGLYKLFGEQDLFIRLYTVGSFLLAIGFTYLFFKSFLPQKNNLNLPLYTTLIFSTGIFLPIYSKIALTDVPLLMYSLGAILSLWKVISIRNGQRTYPWVLGFWTFVALGVLQKGPPILILVGGIVLFVLIFSPRRKYAIRLQPWFFFPLSLLPLFLWGRLAWIETQGEFIKWLIDWYVLRRAGGSVFGQKGPPGYYLLLLFFLLYPWSLYLPKVFKERFHDIREIILVIRQNLLKKDLWNIRSTIRRSISHRKAFLAGWFFSSYLFYELVPSKLPSYALASFPLFSYWIARHYTQQRTEVSFFAKVWFAVVSILLLCILLLLPILWESDANRKSLLVSIGLVLVFLGIFFLFIKSGSLKPSRLPIHSLVPFLGLVVLHIYLAGIYMPLLDSPRNYSEKLTELIPIQDKPAISIHPEISLPSIPLALVRKGIPVDKIHTLNPFSHSSSLEPNSYLLAPRETASLWKELRPNSEWIGCHDFYSYESGKYLSLCWLRLN